MPIMCNCVSCVTLTIWSPCGWRHVTSGGLTHPNLEPGILSHSPSYLVHPPPPRSEAIDSEAIQRAPGPSIFSSLVVGHDSTSRCAVFRNSTHKSSEPGRSHAGEFSSAPAIWRSLARFANHDNRPTVGYPTARLLVSFPLENTFAKEERDCNADGGC